MSTSIKRLPLWFRYLVAVVVGAAVLVALILWVTHNQEPLVESAAPANRHQQAAEVAEDRAVAIQQQAPHRVGISAASPPGQAAAAAITAYVNTQISDGVITGPLDGPASCQMTGQSSAGAAFRCNVVTGEASADASLRYPFDAVVDSHTHQVVYCQVVTPPAPLKPVPVSGACR